MRMRFVVLYLEVETGWKAKKLLGPLNSNNPPIPVFYWLLSYSTQLPDARKKISLIKLATYDIKDSVDKKIWPIAKS